MSSFQPDSPATVSLTDDRPLCDSIRPRRTESPNFRMDSSEKTELDRRREMHVRD